MHFQGMHSQEASLVKTGRAREKAVGNEQVREVMMCEVGGGCWMMSDLSQ